MTAESTLHTLEDNKDIFNYYSLVPRIRPQIENVQSTRSDGLVVIQSQDFVVILGSLAFVTLDLFKTKYATKKAWRGKN